MNVIFGVRKPDQRQLIGPVVFFLNSETVLMEDKNITVEELENWIRLVNTQFYEIAYEDEWLKDVFKIIKKEIITAQQTDFMLGAFGGPKRYAGRNPGDAHPHIFINEDMWQLREDILVRAMDKVACPQWIRDKWLRIDNSFKRSIVMKSPDECKKRWFTDELVVVPKPSKKSA